MKKKSQPHVDVFGSIGLTIKMFPRALLPLLLIVIIGHIFSNYQIIIGDFAEKLSPMLAGTWYILSGFIGCLIAMCGIYIGIKCAQKARLGVKQFFYVFKPYIMLQLFCLNVFWFVLFLVWRTVFLKNTLLFTALFNIPTPADAFDWLALPYFVGPWINTTVYYVYFTLGSLLTLYLFVRSLLSIGLILDKNLSALRALMTSFALTKGQALRIMVLLIAPPLLIFLMQLLLVVLGNHLIAFFNNIEFIETYYPIYISAIESLGFYLIPTFMYLLLGVVYKTLAPTAKIKGTA